MAPSVSRRPAVRLGADNGPASRKAFPRASGTRRRRCRRRENCAPSPGGICVTGPRLYLAKSGLHRNGCRELVRRLRFCALQPRVAHRRGGRLIAASRSAAIPSESSTTTARTRSMPMRSMNVCVLSLYFAFLRYHCMNRAVMRRTASSPVTVHRTSPLRICEPRSPAHVNLPPVVTDSDGSYVLHHGFGAVARTTRGRQLQLSGAVDAAEPAFDLLGQPPCCRRGRTGNNPSRCSSCRSGSSSSPRPAGRHVPGPPKRQADPASECRPDRYAGPPVSFTSGTLCFTATCAMRIRSAGVVIPPGISGTTEKVPSFWMLPCTRS